MKHSSPSPPLCVCVCVCVCLSVYVCIRMDVWKCVHVCMYVCIGHRHRLPIFLNHSPTCFMIQALLPNLELIDWVRLCSQWAPGMYHLSLPATCIVAWCHSIWLCKWFVCELSSSGLHSRPFTSWASFRHQGIFHFVRSLRGATMFKSTPYSSIGFIHSWIPSWKWQFFLLQEVWCPILASLGIVLM